MEVTMNAAKHLHELGQSLWLDNITRGLLVSGTLQRYLQDFAVPGLTSNPTIFDHAIRNTSFYDKAIQEKAAEGKAGEWRRWLHPTQSTPFPRRPSLLSPITAR